jgi:hypothetical protein
MSAGELRWRSVTAGRNAAQRLAARVRQPRWHLDDLRRALVDTDDVKPLRAAHEALHARDWHAAHHAIARAIGDPGSSFVISPALRAGIVARIAEAFPASRAEAAARGDRIVSGDLDLLGYTGLRFDSASGTSIDWHLDPVHERRAPMDFWSNVPYLDPACGDHKIIWELNRHQHLLVLGRAWWLTEDPKYRDRAIAHLTGWMRANPPLIGINWASMLELGFRSISWVWALQFFADEHAGDSEPWLVDVVLGLDRQLTHVEQNLSYYFSPNTHLLGEALALYVCGSALPLLRRAGRYRAVGRRVLIDQIDRQIGKDGGHLERSTHYHRYTLDFYTVALAVARIAGDPAALVFEQAVARLAFAARLLADDRGRLPHIGDDDGGMLLPMCGRAPDDIRDSLAVAGALVDRADLRIGQPPEEAFWMLAHPALATVLERACATPGAAAVGSAALPDMGYYVSRSSIGNHLVVDAGAHGYENGGHAHADALSMTLGVRGRPLLIDPGTACYTTDPATRDRFRSSALHNTVIVDGQSQSVPAGPFHWTRVANGITHAWRVNPGFDYLDASHDGFAPARHRRHVLSLHGDLLVVADLIEGPANHDVRVHWHLDPAWTVRVAGRQAVLRAGSERVELAVSRGAIEAIDGRDDDVLGWHAPVSGRLERTCSLRVTTTGPSPLWVVSVFGLDPANEVLVVEPIPVWAQAGTLARALAVRIARAHSVDVFGLADPAPAGHRKDEPRGGRGGGGESRPARDTWRMGGYETDARMLFCRASDWLSKAALVVGSLVRGADREALSVELPREVPDFPVDFSRPASSAPPAARVSGPVFEAHVQLAGSALPVAVERRATARARSRA